MFNPILNTDGYKASHFLQYPPGTTRVFSYAESRGGVFDRTQFFGLQAILKKEFCAPVTRAHVSEAKELFASYGLPFNEAGWLTMIERHGGRFPLEIRAVPEGSVVPVQNVLMTVVNTDPEFFWLPSYVETALLRIWYPVTVATISWHVRQAIHAALKRTADHPDTELPYKLHDFGARGVSSNASAALGGMGHLVNFKGTDTLAAIVAARDYYHEPMAGASIPAAEHSTITSWGRDGELDAYANMLTQFGKRGKAFACVSDSYDIFAAIERLWGGALRDEVIKSGATLVVRPDSGDPVEIVTKSLELLSERFGFDVNSKGYKVLRHIRVIQGDGVDPVSISALLARVIADGYSAENVAFGMGGALLQRLDRDTQKFAYKCSAAEIGGHWRDVYKDPVTDHAKRSKRGLLGLVKGDNYQTVSLDAERFEPIGGGVDLLRTVYRNGELMVDERLSLIRERAAAA